MTFKLESPGTKPKSKKKGKKTKVLEYDEIIFPSVLDTPEVREHMLLWIAYKQERGEPYRSMMGVTAIFNVFRQFPPKIFCDSVLVSMCSNYAGLFPRLQSPAKSPAAKAQTRPQPSRVTQQAPGGPSPEAVRKKLEELRPQINRILKITPGKEKNSPEKLRAQIAAIKALGESGDKRG